MVHNQYTILIAAWMMASATAQDRIVGGLEAKPNSLVYQVSLQQYGSHFCGGTLIRVNDNKEETDIVITAAHCVYDGYSGLTVTSTGQAIPTRSITVHPKFDPSTKNYNLAIVQQKEPFFNNTGNVIPISIGDSIPGIGTFVNLIGYGNLSSSGTPMTGVVKVVNCSNSKIGKIRITPQMFCTSSPGKDFCNGGIVTHNDKLIGISSMDPGCVSPTLPWVHTRVPMFKKYINNVIMQQR